MAKKKSETKKESRSKYGKTKQDKVIEEIKKGKTQMAVSKKYKIPRSTVWSWCKKAGLVTPMKEIKKQAKTKQQKPKKKTTKKSPKKESPKKK